MRVLLLGQITLTSGFFLFFPTNSQDQKGRKQKDKKEEKRSKEEEKTAMRASSQPHVFCSVIVITLATQLSAAYTFGNYSGDILLAAYFPVHGAASQTLSDNATEYCGEIQEQDGIQVNNFFRGLLASRRDRHMSGFRGKMH